MIGSPVAHPFYAVTGFFAFFLCGYLAHIKINRWREMVGFAPPPSTNQAGNREYNKLLWCSMPVQTKKQIRILQGIGFTLAVVGFLLAA
jgi:hypothetical protein